MANQVTLPQQMIRLSSPVLPVGFSGWLSIGVVVLILSNLVLNYFSIFQAIAPGFTFRSLDATVVACMLIFLSSISQNKAPPRLVPFRTFAFLIMTTALLSTMLTIARYEIPTDEFQRVIRAFIRLIEVMFLGIVMRYFLRSHLVEYVLWLALVGCLILPCYSLYLSITQPGMFTRLGSFVMAGTSVDGLGDVRQANFNELASLCGTLLVVSVALATRSKLSVIARLAAAVATGLFGAGLILTASRSGILASGVGLFMVALFTRGRKMLLFLGLLALTMPFVALEFTGSETMMRRIMETFEAGSLDNQSALVRVEGALAAWYVFLANPLFGVGYACFPLFNDYGFLTPENYFMEILADLGVVGVCVWFWYLSRLCKMWWRCIREIDRASPIHTHLVALAAAAVSLLVGNLSGNNFFDPGLMLLFLFSCAAIEVVASENHSVGSGGKQSRAA